jgi:hypothetical protein
MYYVLPIPGDLDEDGVPEVLTDDLVLNGEDGSKVAKFGLPVNSYTYRGFVGRGGMLGVRPG